MRVLLVEGGKVTNIGQFSEDHELGADQFLADDFPGADVGTPIVDGVPSPAPSPDHAFEGGAWVLNEELAAERELSALLAHAAKVKAECQRRVYAVADVNEQMNMASSQALGRLSAEQSALYAAGFVWITEGMLSACRALAADPSADWQADEAWPAAPEGLVDLVKLF